MNDSPSKTKPEPVKDLDEKKLTPWSCLSGAAISSFFAILLYRLTSSIAQTFVSKPIHSDSNFVINISSAVRTLVVGVTALGTGLFALATVGLVALAIQILIQDLNRKST